eukprot:scaffold30357_cov116-Isochrysis_galbana.AAC.6
MALGASLEPAAKIKHLILASLHGPPWMWMELRVGRVQTCKHTYIVPLRHSPLRLRQPGALLRATGPTLIGSSRLLSLFRALAPASRPATPSIASVPRAPSSYPHSEAPPPP